MTERRAPADDRHGEGEQEPARRTVGVLADPDRPAEIARSLTGDTRFARGLTSRLAELDDSVQWGVEVHVNAVAVHIEELPDVFDAAQRRREEQGWDWVVYLTDLPMRTRRGPVLADLDIDRGVAALSLPALGGFALQRRVATAVVRLVAELSGEAPDSEAERGRGLPFRSRSVAPFLGAVESTPAPERDVARRLIMPPWRGRVRLLAGMVRTNHPGRLIVGMAPAFAATIAASAFMIFNTSTWQIATSASPVRLALAALTGAALLLVWIVVRHGLWELRHSERDRELRRLYNLATLVTIGQGVLALVLVTFLIDVGTVLFLLTPSALALTLGRAPTVVDWLAIASLATIAATLAGALGVGLQRDEDLRNAAYGYRQRVHRRQAQDDRPGGPEEQPEDP